MRKYCGLISTFSFFFLDTCSTISLVLYVEKSDDKALTSFVAEQLHARNHRRQAYFVTSPLCSREIDHLISISPKTPAWVELVMEISLLIVDGFIHRNLTYTLILLGNISR